VSTPFENLPHRAQTKAEALSLDPKAPSLLRAVESQLTGLLAARLPPALYIVATPIGNLGDVTLRALAVLARADTIYCEDTRHSRKLLEHFSIRRPLAAYHDHNAGKERPRIIEAVRHGRIVALISDAGTPLISDPGYKLVREMRAAGLPVVAIPGASAAIAALSAAGLPTDRFFFEGFLPVKAGPRRRRLAELSAVPGTLVFFEAPQRLAEALADMAAVLGDRPAVVARELTKLFEESRGSSLAGLAQHYAGEPAKGEIVVLVGPAPLTEIDDTTIAARLQEALAEMTLRDAARAVADELGIPKARVYDIGVRLKSDGGEPR
jgi:16S rRNA (cytidine1402-2'-O)-methyltransferase